MTMNTMTQNCHTMTMSHNDTEISTDSPGTVESLLARKKNRQKRARQSTTRV